MNKILPLFVLAAACTASPNNSKKILGLSSELSASQSFDQIANAPTDTLCKLAIVRIKNNQNVPFTVNLDKGEVSFFFSNTLGSEGDVYGNFAMNELDKRIEAVRDNVTNNCIANEEWLSEQPLSQTAKKECGYAFYRNTSPNDICNGSYNDNSFEDEALNVRVKASFASKANFNIDRRGPSLSCTTRESFGGKLITDCY